VAEHVEFKPQMKKDGDGKDGEEKAAEGQAEAADDSAAGEVELKEAASF
jgi:hypothetical protein